MTDIIASLQAGDAIELTDAQLLEASLAISDELSSVINGPGIANNVKANAVQLAARVISLSSDPHAPLIEALWTFTAQFGSNYEAYFSAFKEAEEKVEKAAAEVAAANAAAASKKPAVSKGGAPPPSPPPSLISLDDLLNMIPHKQGLDAALSALSGLISTTPSSIIDSIPQSALVQLPKLLRHHSPRIQIRTLVCLKLLLSLNGAHAMSLLSFGAVEELVSLLRSTGKGSIKKASIQVSYQKQCPSERLYRHLYILKKEFKMSSSFLEGCVALLPLARCSGPQLKPLASESSSSPPRPPCHLSAHAS